MFVFSVKKRQIRLAVTIVFVIAMVITLIILSKNAIEASKTAALNINAATAQERIAYLSQFGWSVEEDPIEVCEVIIPAVFDDTYTQYNEIQKNQGFDLSLYCEKRVKRWTYKITNYEGYEDSESIRANLLIYEGKVIGGDICSVELAGFMHGFVRPSAQEDATAAA